MRSGSEPRRSEFPAACRPLPMRPAYANPVNSFGTFSVSEHAKVDRYRAPRWRAAYLLPAVLALAACAGLPGGGPFEVPQATAQAERLVRQGDYHAAAEAYLRLATRVRSPESAAALRLKAASALIDAGEKRAAKRLLDQTGVAGLGAALRAEKDLLQARLDLLEHRPHKALATLGADYGGPLTEAQERRRHELRAEAYAQAGNNLEAARERVKLELFLTGTDAAAKNRRAIWELVNGLGSNVLEQVRPPAPDTLGGWMELALIARNNGTDFDSLASAIQVWRERYPGHPASFGIVPELLNAGRQAVKMPKQIALLLPQEGPFAAASAAVRDGFIAAWFDTPPDAGARPVVAVYDTTPATLWNIYQQAVDAGAEIVVGPLDKESVTLLAHTQRLQVPTLALNQADQEALVAQSTAAPAPAARAPGPGLPPETPGPSRADGPDHSAPALTEGLYQFALAPEDEARQVAEKAWTDGHSRAAVLYPDSDWGRRVSGAFRETWEQIGGTEVEERAYSNQDQELSATVERMLKVDESEQRARLLERQLGVDLKFEPRRRHDIDAVFMAAFPRQARQIKPMLAFYRASDLPVYATSHVYRGVSHPEEDRDLDGVVFGDMPWVLTPESADPALQQDIERNWPNAVATYNRLFAFGVDAYRLVPRLGQLSAQSYARYDGVTGRLALDARSRVRRELSWAQFKDGVARPEPANLPGP